MSRSIFHSYCSVVRNIRGGGSIFFFLHVPSCLVSSPFQASQLFAALLIFIITGISVQLVNFCTIQTHCAHTHKHTHISFFSKHSQTLLHNVSPSPFFYLFIWYSWIELAQRHSTRGADSSAWQIRDFSARRCVRVPFVCCFCLSGSCLLRWWSNPQALITQSCLSRWYGSACWQSQVWTRPKEVDATALVSYCSDLTAEEKKMCPPL